MNSPEKLRAVPVDAETESMIAFQIRLPPHLLAKVEAKRDAMAAAIPGGTITRSDAIRALLLLGLSADGDA